MSETDKNLTVSTLRAILKRIEQDYALRNQAGDLEIVCEDEGGTTRFAINTVVVRAAVVGHHEDEVVLSWNELPTS